MAWPSCPSKSNYDESTDDPSLARSQLALLRDAVCDIITSRSAASGICDLNPSGYIPIQRMLNNFPQNTKLTAYNTTAPSGWELVTLGNTYGIVVDEAGNAGTTWGSHDPKLMDKIPTHNHGTSSMSGQASGTTDSDGTHTHNHRYPTGYLGTIRGIDPEYWRFGVTCADFSCTVSSAGAHTHGVTGISVTLSGNTDNNTSGSNWTPRQAGVRIINKKADDTP